MNDPKRPVGVFDSGAGGLTVLTEIEKLLPNEDCVYFGDLANAPYGGRPQTEVEALTLQACQTLMEYNVKAIVLACNTATAAAVATLRAQLPLPIIGMEPALKPAVALTRTGHVAVLATALTLRERKFNELLEHIAHGARVTRIAAPELVLRVEQGLIGGEETAALLRRLLAPALEQQADVIVLGCTHFSFLTPALRAAAGPGVQIIDGNGGTARRLRQVLSERGELADGGPGRVTLIGSGDPIAAGAHLERFLELARTL